MAKMDDVITLRLHKKDIDIVKRISLESKKDKSTTIRELISLGKIYFAIKKYKQEKISLEKAAEIASMELSEMIDLLSEFGIKSNLDLSDYLQGKDLAEELI